MTDARECKGNCTGGLQQFAKCNVDSCARPIAHTGLQSKYVLYKRSNVCEANERRLLVQQVQNRLPTALKLDTCRRHANLFVIRRLKRRELYV